MPIAQAGVVVVLPRASKLWRSAAGELPFSAPLAIRHGDAPASVRMLLDEGGLSLCLLGVAQACCMAGPPAMVFLFQVGGVKGEVCWSEAPLALLWPCVADRNHQVHLALAMMPRFVSPRVASERRVRRRKPCVTARCAVATRSCRPSRAGRRPVSQGLRFDLARQSSKS